MLKSKSDKRLNDRKITIEKAFHYSNMLNKYNYLIREMLKINENLFNSYEELLYFFQNNDFYIIIFGSVNQLIDEFFTFFQLLEEILYRRDFSGISDKKQFDKIVYFDVVNLLNLVRKYYFFDKRNYFKMIENFTYAVIIK